jgi:hypothetical protein
MPFIINKSANKLAIRVIFGVGDIDVEVGCLWSGYSSGCVELEGLGRQL